MWPLHKVEECKLDKSAKETKACRQERIADIEGTNRKMKKTKSQLNDS